MIQQENKEVYTTLPESKRIKRKAHDELFTRTIMFPTETTDDFEEVDFVEETETELE